MQSWQQEVCKAVCVINSHDIIMCVVMVKCGDTFRSENEHRQSLKAESEDG